MLGWLGKGENDATKIDDAKFINNPNSDLSGSLCSPLHAQVEGGGNDNFGRMEEDFRREEGGGEEDEQTVQTEMVKIPRSRQENKLNSPKRSQKVHIWGEGALKR